MGNIPLSQEREELVEYDPKVETIGEKTLSVYFCGTDGSIGPTHSYTQIRLFSNYTEAFDISNPKTDITDVVHFKMSFDGCGVTNGLMGTVFAQGLSEQCQEVVDRVLTLINAQYKVCLNCLGLSRGGIALIILAKRLAKIDKRLLQVNLLLFDPVPGNLVSSASVDIFSSTITNQCMDFGESKNLNRVLALYPHEPLPDFAFHAPIIPKYPSTCNVEQDVILGCHQGALFYPDNLTCKISFLRIKEFLLKCGTQFSEEINKIYTNEEHILYEMEKQLKIVSTTTRHTHSQPRKVIVRKETGKYLNRYHEQLCNKYKRKELEEEGESMNTMKPKYMLDIEDQDNYYFYS